MCERRLLLPRHRHLLLLLLLLLLQGLGPGLRWWLTKRLLQELGRNAYCCLRPAMLLLLLSVSWLHWC